MKKVILSLAILTAMAANAAGNDPVLMTVAGKDVKLSEFEYLYQKNNAQQMATQPVDEYLQMFIDYKLKVADAEANGVATDDAFLKEYNGYVRELSEPYLVDNSARDSINHVIYDRMHDEVDVSHIMVSLAQGIDASAAQQRLLDSIRTEIVAGRADFAEMADKYSIDPGVSRNHGHMGIINAGVFPYTFEDAAWQTPIGSISEVIRTPFGYHIVKVNDRRPNSGQVKVQHILKLTMNKSAQEQAKAKAEIDSIYTLLINGANFDSLARKESEDPGSARNGGLLDWFGRGRMVPEFEATSFALHDGEISEPFATSYGYHIVKRLDSKGIDSYQALEPTINNYVNHDERRMIPMQVKTVKLRGKYGVKVDNKVVNAILADIDKTEVVDSVFVAPYRTDTRKVVTLKGKNGVITVADVFNTLPDNFITMAPDQAKQFVVDTVKELADNAAVNAERSNLANENPDYRNLLNEYRDGMLLFEISDRNVWSKSKDDKEGLNAYFEANRDKYSTWTSPRFKGYVIFATSQEDMDKVKVFLESNDIAYDLVPEALRINFGKDIKAERVLAAQGENAITDYLAFGGEKPAASGRWAYYFAWGGRMIDQPEEPADSRGAVVADYQTSLEQQWLEQLRAKYPVKVNRKVFDKYKASLENK